MSYTPHLLKMRCFLSHTGAKTDKKDRCKTMYGTSEAVAFFAFGLYLVFIRPKKRFSGAYPVMRLMYSSMRLALSSFMRSVT